LEENRSSERLRGCKETEGEKGEKTTVHSFSAQTHHQTRARPSNAEVVAELTPPSVFLELQATLGYLIKFHIIFRVYTNEGEVNKKRMQFLDVLKV